VEDFELLTENAKKRLSALEENSELGSGSTLAMHDLEIRGGGTIYGENQSGQIDDIGLSLYLKILEDEIQKLTVQGAENLKSNFKDIDIRLTVQTYFSDEVIPNEQARLELYRRITELNNIKQIDEIKNEILDRFGQLDYFAENFFLLVKIRILAEKKDIVSISNFEKDISLFLANDKKIFLKSPTKDDDDILLTVFNYLKNL
jgi:transcription-repair coupling factor (superfamily II helicase)